MQGTLARILSSIPWRPDSQRQDELAYFVRGIPEVAGHFFGRDNRGRAVSSNRYKRSISERAIASGVDRGALFDSVPYRDSTGARSD